MRAWFDALDPRPALAPLAAARGVLRVRRPRAQSGGMLRLEAGDRLHGTLDPQARPPASSRAMRPTATASPSPWGCMGHEARVEVTLHHCPPPDRSGRPRLPRPSPSPSPATCDTPGETPREATADRGAALAPSTARAGRRAAPRRCPRAMW